jgi:DNA-directed RNA polymerase subunit RPC12/RpoP
VESNDTPRYKHWHVVCAACGKITLGRPCTPRREIEPIEHNPVIKCQHCEDTRQYLTKDCFLAPLSAAAADKSAGALAVVAGLIAAVKLARVESAEIQNRSPRVRSIISESITIARMVVEASKAKL